LTVVICASTTLVQNLWRDARNKDNKHAPQSSTPEGYPISVHDLVSHVPFSVYPSSPTERSSQIMSKRLPHWVMVQIVNQETVKN
jgi:hypothetical protein